METLATIREEDVQPKPHKAPSVYQVREASRGIVFNDDGLIALLHVRRFAYHKLPGGGIDDGESRQEAFIREVQEETGCVVEINGELGEIIEFRDAFGLEQHSYGYWGHVVKDTGDFAFTQKEIDEDFALKWVPLEDAINIIASDVPENYEGRFIVKRDIILLKELQRITSQDGAATQ